MTDNETIADIIEEMRGMGNYQRYSGDHARVLANRLEAAWKRDTKELRVEVYFTPKAALDVIREQPADIVLANPPLEFATGSGGYLCEIAREMEGITPERMTI